MAHLVSAGARAGAGAGAVNKDGASKWEIVRRRLTPEARAEVAKKRNRRSMEMWNKAVTPELLARIRDARGKGQRNRVLRLIKKMDKNFENWSDKLMTEVFLLSHDAFDFFTPSKSPKYPLFSATFLVANVAVFAAMAAEFPWYQTEIADAPLPNGFSYRVGPRGLRDFCNYNHEYYTFSGAFLVLWGGRYNPAIHDGDDHRWFTSLFVHSSFQHIFSNMLLFVSLAAPLVRTEGGVVEVLV